MSRRVLPATQAATVAPIMAHTNQASVASHPHLRATAALHHPLHEPESESAESSPGSVTGEGQFTAS
jgi:hypothetical protein